MTEPRSGGPGGARRVPPWGRLVLPLAAIVVAGAFVRLLGLGRQSLWVDELITLKAANIGGQLTPTDFLRNIQGPLHALIVHWVAKLSTTDAALRSASAIAGILTIPVMAELGRRMFDRRTGLIAALLFAVSPFSVWYSQEVRNYSLLILAAALSTLFVWRIATERRGGFVAYVASTVAALYLNLSGAFLAAGHGLFLIWRLAGDRRRLVRWIAAALIIGALFVPGLLGLRHWTAVDDVGERVTLSTDADPEELLRGETTFTPAALPYSLFALTYGYSLGPTLAEMHRGSPASAFREHLPVVGAAVLVAAAAWLLGLARLATRRDAGALVLASLLVPAAGAVAMALANIKPFNVRYLSPGLPALVLLAAAGVGLLRKRPAVLLCAALVVFCGLSIRNYHLAPEYGREDVRSAVATIEEGERPGDVILAPVVRDIVRHYYGGAARVEVLYPAQTGSDQEVASRIEGLVDGAQRVWYIECRPWHVDPAGRIPAYLDGAYEPVATETYPGVRLTLYRTRGDESPFGGE